MSYIDDIYSRLNLQQIQTFLLSGGQVLKIHTETYEQRLEKCTLPVREFLEKRLSPKETETAIEKMMPALSAYQEVFMEVGMRAGASLAVQLLQRKAH